VPYADNNGIRIRYEVDGSGPPLVLHVGFAGWLENWADAGYVAALRETNRLVLLDPRGQGRSDGPQDPAAYSANNRVGDILAVLDAEGIDRAHFWGYSMGGHVGYALGRLAPGRVRSLILGGASPFAGYPRTAEGDAMMDSLRKGMAGLAAQWEAEFPDCWLSPGERERTLASDAKALAAARLAHLTQPDLPEDAVARIRTPALLYVGTLDEPDLVERAARLMPNAAFVALAGLDHAQAFERSDQVLPSVRTFLTDVETSRTARS
jgi:pimeloyl-ACP methyl ester carboxylesterase